MPHKQVWAGIKLKDILMIPPFWLKSVAWILFAYYRIYILWNYTIFIQLFLKIINPGPMVRP